MRGSQLAEFGAALVLFVLCVIVPTIDFGIVPIRTMMAQEILGKQARRLAFADNFSSALAMLENDSIFNQSLVNLGGVTVDTNKVYLQISNATDKKRPFLEMAAGTVPNNLLPSPSNQANTYNLILEVRLLLSPAFLVPAVSAKIPGITAPFPITLRASHSWENLGRNPETGKFYLNE